MPIGSEAGSRRARSPQLDVVGVIAAGGALGGLARWSLNEVVPTAAGGFPWSTFIENVTGGLLLGALMVVLLEVRPPGRYARPFLGVGLLGGFTTFSTYTSDVRALLLGGYVPTALVYLFGTVLVCLAATWTGMVVARTATGTGRPGTGGAR